MRNHTIKEHTFNLFDDHKNELIHRIEVLNHYTTDGDIRYLLDEIIENFHQKNEILATTKILLFMKLVVANFDAYSYKMEMIDMDECSALIDICLSLINAASIYHSPALQAIIVASEKYD